MKRLIFFTALFLYPLLSTPVHAEGLPLLSSEKPQQLVIQNRILAKVNSKAISVLDVVKKMEVFLNKYYPQYASSVPAKFQYFSSQWRETLLQMIDHELILADASKLDLKITDAEVRETLHDRFGPNIMKSLDALGLSYEEAREMIHSELVVQKMTWFKVHAKALNAVNVQDIKAAYASYCEKNPPQETWEYQVLSVKAQNEEMAQKIAQKAFELCKQADIKEVPELIHASLEPEYTAQDFTITLSEELKSDSKNISTSHRDTLLTLSKNSISKPIRQVTNRSPETTNNSAIFRIFHLKDHTKTVLPSLRSMYEKLQNELVQAAVQRESRAYLSKLRDRYGFDTRTLDDTIPPDFQPFSLR